RTDLHFDNSGIRRHSYECSYSFVQTALHFRKLSNEMLKDIEFYTKSAEGMDAKIQYNLLKVKYSASYIDKKDLSNAIQKFKILSCEKTKTDTTKTLQQLIALKAVDPG
ncbi:22824_t:CDS:2, partial [Racocetra persica]